MALPWLRLYTEFASDPKIQIMAFEDQRHFVMLLCLKGNGVLDSECPNDPYRERLIAKALGLDPVSAAEAKRRLLEGGLISDDWQPSAWDKRQFESDTSAERTRRYREKLKGNVTVTSQKRPCDAIDKIRRDKNREDKKAQAPVGLDTEAWERWQTYRKATGKAIKPASIEAAQKKLAAFGKDQSRVVEESIAQSYQGLFPLKNSPAPIDTAKREARLVELEAQAATLGIARHPTESFAVFETRLKQASIAPIAVPPPDEIRARMSKLARSFTQ